MLTLTSDASQAIEQILTSPELPDGAGVRIESAGAAQSHDGARPEGGELRIVVAAAAADGDEIVEDEGARVFIEPEVSPFLDDKLLDVAGDGPAVEFTLAVQP